MIKMIEKTYLQKRNISILAHRYCWKVLDIGIGSALNGSVEKSAGPKSCSYLSLPVLSSSSWPPAAHQLLASPWLKSCSYLSLPVLSSSSWPPAAHQLLASPWLKSCSYLSLLVLSSSSWPPAAHQLLASGRPGCGSGSEIKLKLF